MKKIFTASRIGGENKLFPAKIICEDTTITLKVPGFFSNNDTKFLYENVSKVNVDCPMIGWSTIYITVNSATVTATGFTKGDVQSVEEIIMQAKANSRKGGSGAAVMIDEKAQKELSKLQVEQAKAAAKHEREMMKAEKRRADQELKSGDKKVVVDETEILKIKLEHERKMKEQEIALERERRIANETPEQRVARLKEEKFKEEEKRKNRAEWYLSINQTDKYIQKMFIGRKNLDTSEEIVDYIEEMSGLFDRMLTVEYLSNVPQYNNTLDRFCEVVEMLNIKDPQNPNYQKYQEKIESYKEFYNRMLEVDKQRKLGKEQSIIKNKRKSKICTVVLIVIAFVIFFGGVGFWKTILLIFAAIVIGVYKLFLRE